MTGIRQESVGHDKDLVGYGRINILEVPSAFKATEVRISKVVGPTWKVSVSAWKSSLKTAKRLQLDWTKTAKDWTCSLGLADLRLKDRKKTG